MAASILEFKFSLSALKLIPSTGGVFEIRVNGRRVYSKKATGQFPDPDAVVRDVRRLL
ncbi:MAG: SelT/SelW/SelH family protein [Verrucomicrobiales bacterium]|nr:SelT/SelW/SelH family protein [Verrucomicrobiales bacterium]MCP5527296.1 SelT/SelW/SelH family protein [Verrucomicrobiales bacterium]